MEIEPYAFADQSNAEQEYFGIQVITPAELVNFPEAAVLIASYNYFDEMLSFLISIGHEKIYDILALIRLDYDESLLSEYAIDEKHNWRKYEGVVEHAGKEGIVITHLELVLTECCTLRCRDCANLMQYYKHPEKLDTEKIINDFNRFLRSIDLLLELRLLGGEPFLCIDIDKIISEFSNNEKIKRITIYTNSTIIPAENVLNSLKNKKVSIHLSDYGKVSCKLDKLREILTEKGIDHYVHRYEKWHDLGRLEKRKYNVDQIKTIFKNCLMAKCYTFYRGKLYLCPRAAHGEGLGVYKSPYTQYIDFTEDIDIETAKEKLHSLLESTEYIEACNYCNGSSSRSKEIDAGVQMEKRK